MQIAIVNGPNLGNIGLREPHIYGTRSMDDTLLSLGEEFPEVEFVYCQSNHEGALIDFLYAEGQRMDGIILNAGAYTHTSIALLDAVRAIAQPVVEVHLSNVYARESFRHQSIIAPACVGLIAGFGVDSYRLAVLALMMRLETK